MSWPPCSPSSWRQSSKSNFSFSTFANLLEHYLPRLLKKKILLYLTRLLAWTSSVTFNFFISFARQCTLCNVTSPFFIHFILYTSIVHNLGQAFFPNLDNEEVSHPVLILVSHGIQPTLRILPTAAPVLFWWHSFAPRVIRWHSEDSQEKAYSSCHVSLITAMPAWTIHGVW